MLNAEQIKHFSSFFDYDFTKTLPQKKKKYDYLTEDWIADVHAPYYHTDNYNIATNSNSAMLRILGDFFDMYSKSHFRKTKDINFEKEFRQAYWLLADTCTRYEKVYIMLSNHDERFKKWLYDNAPKEVIGIIGTGLNLVENLLSLIPNLKIMRHEVEGGRKIGYIAQVENAVFTHIEKSAKQPGKVVQDIHFEFTGKWKDHYKLNPYNIIVQAHNHISYSGWSGDTRLFQIPCLIDSTEIAFDYCYSGKLQGNPAAQGYIKAHKDKNGTYDNYKTHIVDL